MGLKIFMAKRQKGAITMLAVLITGACVSPGYQDEPAIRFADSGKAAFFKIGKKVYDPNAENKQRWINISVKGFGDIPGRVEKMQLKEKSFINIRGRLDEDVWETKNGETRRALVVVAEDIEYAGGGKQKENDSGEQAAYGAFTAPAAPPPEEAPGEFTGYECFGGDSFFD